MKNLIRNKERETEMLCEFLDNPGRDMKLVVLAAISALSFLATAANADTIITYDIGTTTATYSGGGADTLTGTFTVDFTTDTLTAFDITVTGNVTPAGTSPEVFSTPNSFSSTLVSGQDPTSLPAFMTLSLVFQNALGNSPDPITQANFSAGSIGFFLFSTSANGTATPVTPSAVPIPAALPLFATGLGALGLLGWRRKKKSARAA